MGVWTAGRNRQVRAAILGPGRGIRDTRLVGRGLRERRPIPKAIRKPLIERLAEIVHDTDSSPREVTSAAKAILSASKINLETIAATIKAQEHEEVIGRIEELEKQTETPGHSDPPQRIIIPSAWRVVIGLGKIAVGDLAGFFHEPAMSDDHTMAVVERYMIALAGDAPAEAAVEPRPAAALGATDRPPPGAKPPGSIQVQTART